MMVFSRDRSDVHELRVFCSREAPLRHHPPLVDFRNARLLFEKALVW
jgi:hypothetical protein